MLAWHGTKKKRKKDIPVNKLRKIFISFASGSEFTLSLAGCCSRGSSSLTSWVGGAFVVDESAMLILYTTLYSVQEDKCTQQLEEKKKKKTRLQDKGIQRYIFYSYSYSHSLYQRNSIIFPVFRSSPQRFIIIIVSEGMPLIAQVDNLIANQTLSINITLYNYGLSYIWYQIYLFATFVNFARIKHQLFLIILHAFNFVWYFFLNTDNFSLRMNIISYAGKNGPRQPKPTPLMNVPI